jgi:hypothetical protein
MSGQFWNAIKAAPVVLGASLLAAQSATAAPGSDVESALKTNLEQPNPETLLAQAAPEYAQPGEALGVLRNRPTIKVPGTASAPEKNEAMSQVTSVSELRDVEPTAWAYEALKSLVERYGCIVGYPDRTFRGNRALTRWEFAAGLNACMNVIERLIQENVAVLREDIEKLKRLAEEFQAELAALGTRIDNLENRVTFLEDHQFSTTTKLKGEVVFSLADSFGDQAVFENRNVTDFYGTQTVSVRNPAREDKDVSQTAFNNRVRLNLETSFTGKDLLKTRLQAGNFGTTFNQAGPTGTNMTRLAYDDGRDNNVTIDEFYYRTPLFDKNLTFWIGAKALKLDNVLPTNNPYLESSGTGSLSRLMRYNNMVYRGPQGAGAALKYKFSDEFYIVGTYLADDNDAPDPTEGNGLFNGSFSGGAQIGYDGKSFDIALAYVNTYRTAGGTGLFGGITSNDADKPFGNNVPTSANRFGLSLSWDFAEWANFFGWFGYGNAVAQESVIVNRSTTIDGTLLTRDVAAVQQGDTVDLWTWNVGFNFLDLGTEGAVLTIGGGLPPKGNVSDSSYIIQTQYQYPLNKNILLTPGFYVILNPNNNSDNNSIWMGVLRTTFKF